MIRHLSASWQSFLQHEIAQPYFIQLLSKLDACYREQKIYPPAESVFHALNLCPPDKTKVVIIGQDPYHGAGQAHGLSFSVNDGIKLPPSLRNIFKELITDVPGFEVPWSGNLEKWAAQGVLLLNTILTVEAGNPGSHKGLGWENFTDAIIRSVSDSQPHVVFMLWGNHAIAKSGLIDQDKHLVLTAAHPSPLARGAFFGSGHFSKANQFLESKGITGINWQL